MIGVGAAAALPAALYFLYVYHFSVNLPIVDDWQLLPLVGSAVHGHLQWDALWGQWTEAREVTGRLVFIAFGFLDHLDLRAVMLFSAALYILTFVVLLSLCRSYWGKQLEPIPVLVLGIVWFSLVDFQSALWSTNVNGYLTICFVILTLYFLLVPQQRERLFFVLGIVAAVLASLSFLHGFFVWPLGLICMVWSPKRRRRADLITWVVVALVTVGLYFYNYNSANPACHFMQSQCTLTFSLSHPGRFIEYFVLLVGNVIPSSTTGVESVLAVHGVQGVVLLLVAIVVAVQTVRDRRVQSNPLPLLLVVFALLFDAMTAIGRDGAPLATAVAPINDRWTLPNVILLAGIVVYAWAHVPNLIRAYREAHGRPELFKLISFGTLMAFVVVQCALATNYGLTYGRESQQRDVASARIVVNLGRLPVSERACYVDEAVWPGWTEHIAWIEIARRDHLTVFGPGIEHHYRVEGPQRLSVCDSGHGITLPDAVI